MKASEIEPRAVAKLVVLVLFFAALAVLLAIVILHTRTTLRWVAASVFLALALDPAVSRIQRIGVRGHAMPRVGAIGIVYLLFCAALVFLILHVFPPIVRDVESLAKSLPTYVKDFESWAEHNQQFRELNDRYDLTAKLSDQASGLPSTLGSGASELGSLTVRLLEHLVAAITVLTLTFFLLLDGGGMFERGTGRLRAPTRDRLRRVGARIAEVVRAYVSVNVLLAVAVGFATWVFLELIGFHLALPMAVLVGFLDLIPLVGLTVGGAIVAVVLLIDGQPGHVIVWLALFLAYQQAQDRVIQPILYKGGALKINPAVAIVAVLVGANLAGVLGALLAIPTAASLGVIVDEFVLPRPRTRPRSGAAAKPKPAE